LIYRINKEASLSFDLLVRGAGEEFLDLGAQALLLLKTSLIFRVHFSKPLSMQLLAFLEVHILLVHVLLE